MPGIEFLEPRSRPGRSPAHGRRGRCSAPASRDPGPARPARMRWRRASAARRSCALACRGPSTVRTRSATARARGLRLSVDAWGATRPGGAAMHSTPRPAAAGWALVGRVFAAGRPVLIRVYRRCGSVGRRLGPAGLSPSRRGVLGGATLLPTRHRAAGLRGRGARPHVVGARPAPGSGRASNPVSAPPLWLGGGALGLCRRRGGRDDWASPSAQQLGAPTAAVTKVGQGSGAPGWLAAGTRHGSEGGSAATTCKTFGAVGIWPGNAYPLGCHL